MCLIRCAVRPSFLQGGERQSGLVDGDLGDLDPNLGAEADPLRVLGRVPARGCFPLPASHSPPALQAARCRKTCCLTSGGRKAVSLRKVHFSSLI